MICSVAVLLLTLRIWEAKVTKKIVLVLNASKHYLGKLCKSNHEYNGTSKSLRYKKHYQCVQCAISRKVSKETFKVYREKNKEKIKIYSCKKYQTTKSNPLLYEKHLEKQRNNREKNKDKINEKLRQRYAEDSIYREHKRLIKRRHYAKKKLSISSTTGGES